MEQIRLENFSKSVKLKYLINSTIIDYIEQMIEVRQIEKDTINFQVYIFFALVGFALSDRIPISRKMYISNYCSVKMIDV